MSLNFLFTTWEGGGNVTPALKVVRLLTARGHRVRVLGEECNRPEAEKAGALFRTWKRAPNRQDRTPATQTFRDWAAASPQEGLISILQDVWCGPALAYAQDLLEEIENEPADLVVTSEMLFGVMAACESIGQKLVTFSPNIRLAPMPGLPPMGPGLSPARTDEERRMHAEITRGVEGLFDSGLPALNAARVALGLDPLAHLLDQFHACKLELLATSRAFDFPTEQLPDNIRYVGPQIDDPAWAQEWTSPWPLVDERPLVVVGFSTTFQNHGGVLQKVIDALATVPARVLVTLGGSISANDLTIPENCIVVDSAPHSVIMREAALVVTHGGHGTCMVALTSQTPLLVIPHGRDQNDNAARITERGAGLSLSPDTSVEAVREACTRLLQEPSFRAAAKRLGDLVASDAQHSTVVQELEAAAAAFDKVRLAEEQDSWQMQMMASPI